MSFAVKVELSTSSMLCAGRDEHELWTDKHRCDPEEYWRDRRGFVGTFTFLGYSFGRRCRTLFSILFGLVSATVAFERSGGFRFVLGGFRDRTVSMSRPPDPITYSSGSYELLTTAHCRQVLSVRMSTSELLSFRDVSRSAGTSIIGKVPASHRNY